MHSKMRVFVAYKIYVVGNKLFMDWNLRREMHSMLIPAHNTILFSWVGYFFNAERREEYLNSNKH